MVAGENQDPRVVVTRAELAGGADHAVTDVTVGLARSDLEAAGQGRSGQCDDDEVALREVECAADDASGLALADIDRGPADGLAVGVLFVHAGEHPRDDQRPGDLRTRALDCLDLEAERHQPLGKVAPPDVRWQVDVLPQPGHRRAHQISVRIRCTTDVGRTRAQSRTDG